MTTTRAGMALEAAVDHADARTPDTAYGSVSTALRPSQSLNPTTSLSMTYLRAFADSGVRGQVRLRRKAEHLLRMHWSACVTDNDSRSNHVLEASR